MASQASSAIFKPTGSRLAFPKDRTMILIPSLLDGELLLNHHSFSMKMSQQPWRTEVFCAMEGLIVVFWMLHSFCIS